MELASETAATGSMRRAAHHITAREWLLLLVLAAVQFTHIVDFMIIMPLGPTYMREMKLKTEEFGHIVAAYTVAAGSAGFLASRILDRFGRKRALLTLYSGFVIGTFLCAAAPDYGALLAARTVAGAFGGVAAAVVLAIVGDVFPDIRRGAAMGVIMSALSVASIVGVPFGLKLEEWFSWHAPFLALGSFGLVIIVLATILLPPLRGHIGRHPPRTRSEWTMIFEPRLFPAFLLTASLMFGSFMLGLFLASFLEFNVGVPHNHIYLVYLFGGIVTLGTLTPIGRLADEYGKLPVFRICAAAMIIVVVILTHLPPNTAIVWVLVTTTAFMLTSSARTVPSTALITACTAPGDRGAFMSLNACVQHFSIGGATILAGYLVAQPDGKALEGFETVGLIACVATLISIVLAGRLQLARGGMTAPDAAEVDRDEPIVAETIAS